MSSSDTSRPETLAGFLLASITLGILAVVMAFSGNPLHVVVEGFAWTSMGCAYLVDYVHKRRHDKLP